MPVLGDVPPPPDYGDVPALEDRIRIVETYWEHGVRPGMVEVVRPPVESPAEAEARLVERGLGGLFIGPVLRSILDGMVAERLQGIAE